MPTNSLIDESAMEQALHMLRGGADVETIMTFLGITVEQYDEWMDRGRRAKSGKHYDFFVSITRAQAEADLKDFAVLQTAASDSWQAAAKRLELRHEADRRADFRRLRELTT